MTSLALTCLSAALATMAAQRIVVNVDSSPMSQTNRRSSMGGRSGHDDSEADSLAVEIVERALELFNCVLTSLRESTRAGGHVVQNFVSAAAILLLRGLSDDLFDEHAGAEKASGLSSVRSFGVLHVALASQALSLSATLMEDAATEVDHQDVDGDDVEETDLFRSLPGNVRASKLFLRAPFVHLLFRLADLSYRKSSLVVNSLKAQSAGCKARDTSKHQMTTPPPPPALTSYVEDIEVDTSEDDDDEDEERVIVEDNEEEDEEDDEDDEPLFGKWFDEALFPPEEDHADAEGGVQSKDVQVGEDANLSYGSVGECDPAGFLSLAAHIFLFMNQHLLGSHLARKRLKSSLSGDHLSVLAAILVDLDDNGAAFSSAKYPLYSHYVELSTSVCRFAHNLLAAKMFSRPLADRLLMELGVSAVDDAEEAWPLHIRPRSLSIFAQVHLIREQEFTGGRGAKASNVRLWERVLLALGERIRVGGQEEDDFNVEHAQFLLFIFHSLALMQKKQVE